jgi:hypothetical protein
MAGSPDVSGINNPFGDVDSTTYYANAVKWAYSNGIVNGYGDSYGPNDNISKQDLTVILNNYAEHAGLTLPEAREYTGFDDEADIENYAKDAIEKFFKSGIINGKGANEFGATGEATRAEVAVMLMKMIEAGE